MCADFGGQVRLYSAIALVTKDHTIIRFGTDRTLRYQQTTEQQRRLTFTYTPELPEEIQGKATTYLSSIETLAFDYAEILKIKHFDTTTTPAKLICAISVNGIQVSNFSIDLPAGLLAKGEAQFNVAPGFATIPATYEKAVARQ